MTNGAPSRKQTRRSTSRLAATAAITIAVVLSWPSAPARAEAMDPVLSRLRLAATDGDCAAGASFCADQASFERLVADLGMAFAQPVVEPAHTDGPSGAAVSLTSTVTTVDADARHFREASEGGVRGREPDAALLVHRLHARKGLPLGFEVAGAFGMASQTSLWTLGVRLKLALFEGFRTGLGVLPDASLRISWDAVVGSSSLSLHVLAADLVFSKPLVVAPRFRIAPMVGVQLSEVRGASGQVDLTPETDAFAECLPSATAATGAPACTGDRSDLQHSVRFAPVSQVRVRFVAGVAAELHFVRLALSVMTEIPGTAPSTSVANGEGVRGPLAVPLSATASAGVAF